MTNSQKIAKKIAKRIAEQVADLIIDEMNEHYDPGSQEDADKVYCEIVKQLKKTL